MTASESFFEVPIWEEVWTSGVTYSAAALRGPSSVPLRTSIDVQEVFLEASDGTIRCRAVTIIGTKSCAKDRRVQRHRVHH